MKLPSDITYYLANKNINNNMLLKGSSESSENEEEIGQHRKDGEERIMAKHVYTQQSFWKDD